MIPGSEYSWYVFRVERILEREIKTTLETRAAFDHFNARRSEEECARYIEEEKTS